VPLHLITREALELYMRKLADRGVVAFHVSNRYLDLPPVLAGICRDMKLACLVRADLDYSQHVAGQDPSIWVVVAGRPSAFTGLPRQPPADVPDPTRSLVWRTIPGVSREIWTDERANLFSAWGMSDAGQVTFPAN
jgi:hypothetical protein